MSAIYPLVPANGQSVGRPGRALGYERGEASQQFINGAGKAMEVSRRGSSTGVLAAGPSRPEQVDDSK